MKKLFIVAAFLIFALAGCSLQQNKVEKDFGAVSDVSKDKLTEKYNASPKIKEKYVLEGSVLKREVKEDSRDRIEVKIGNTNFGAATSTEFTPDIEFSRWDEVSFKLSPQMQSALEKDKTLTFEDEKIKYATKKEEIHFYELPKDEANPDGAFEIEWILKEKPNTNIVEFQLDTQGLDFFYQLPLDKENNVGQEGIVSCTETQCFGEDDEVIMHRPENIVGSYAIYASEEKINWINGKEYKIGKVGHIYRPKIIDSAGTEVWGELHVENGILSVTIPQKFLDEAVYPVLVDPTIGYQVQPGTSTSPSTNDLRGTYSTVSVDGTVNIIWMYVNKASSDYKGILVASSTYTIVTNGVGSVAVSIGGTAWASSTFSTNPVITAGDYVVSEVMSSGLGNFFLDGATGQNSILHANNYTTPVDPTTATFSTNKYGFFAVYSPTAAGTYTDNYNDDGTFSWIAPTGVTSVNVACWGAGAGGSGTGGGGGGAYAASNGISVTAGNSYQVIIGAGGISNGVASSFNLTTVVAAGGDISGNGVNGGAGGTVADSTGDTEYAGGTGGAGGATGGGGGGGGGAGTDGAGVNGDGGILLVGGNGGNGDASSGGAGGTGGNAANGTAGTSNALGGGGGGGGGNTFNGASGGLPGGGGGAGTGTDGGGRDGQCEITYTIAAAESSSYCSHSGGDWYINSNCYVNSNTTTSGFIYIGTDGQLHCIDGVTISSKGIKGKKGTQVTGDKSCKFKFWKPL